MHGPMASFCSAVLLMLATFPDFLNAQNPAETAGQLLRQGAAEYDSVLIKRAIVAAGNERTGKRYLFDAACCYRLQTVAYLAGNKKEIARYGEQALAYGDTAKSLGADLYSVYVVRTYVSQLMAGLGITSGAKYGPLIGSNFKAMKALNPNGYDTRFIDCVNLLEMPSFIGGNPKKALPLLEALYCEYPDSTAVGISLARGLVKAGKTAEAVAIFDLILASNPKNAMARKERERLR